MYINYIPYSRLCKGQSILFFPVEKSKKLQMRRQLVVCYNMSGILGILNFLYELPGFRVSWFVEGFELLKVNRSRVPISKSSCKGKSFCTKYEKPSERYNGANPLCHEFLSRSINFSHFFVKMSIRGLWHKDWLIQNEIFFNYYSLNKKHGSKIFLNSIFGLNFRHSVRFSVVINISIRPNFSAIIQPDPFYFLTTVSKISSSRISISYKLCHFDLKNLILSCV